MLQYYDHYRRVNNVGQGDSTLIQVNDKVVLIDAGTRESQEDIAKHLKAHNITTIPVSPCLI